MSGNSTGVTSERRREALRAHTERLAEQVAATDSDAPVPTCPGWTVADLVAHVGHTQHWVAEIIERRIVDPTELPTEMASVPSEPDQWPTWLNDGGARAVAACTDEALAAPVFNAAADDRTGGEFWLSSLLNEAVIHGADAAAAAGSDYDVDADVAAALITNHLAMLTSPTWAAQRPESAHALRGAGETLHLHATDDGGDWFIERGPEGAAWHARAGEADVSVSGPASALLLILTRRRELADESGRVGVEGDLELIRHWIENSAHVAD